MAEPSAVQVVAATFLYGYPLDCCVREIAKLPAGEATTVPAATPFNTFGAARELLGAATKFVSPNNDTAYLIAPCDVRGGPLVLHVPATHGRYYVLQFVDAWSNNFAYVGRRATGTEAADYLLVGPDYTGEVPTGMPVVTAPTGVFVIVGRIQVDGTADLPAVHDLQDRFTLRSLNPDAPAPQGVPTPDPAVPAELAFWERLRVWLQAFPPPESEAGMVAHLAPLGLTASTSRYVDPDPELAELLVEGQRAGDQLLDKLMHSQPATPSGWSAATHIFDYNTHALGIGTIDRPDWRIDDPQRAFAARAVAARAGLWGNHGYEAAYFLTFVDGTGEPLTGAHTYELRLDVPPPVGAFWSLTMYAPPDFYLVDNPIGRYSIGDRTPGLMAADDGSITLYLQRDRPAGERSANWLPTPAGAFRPILRMYEPTPAVTDGDYELPPIRRTS